LTILSFTFILLSPCFAQYWNLSNYILSWLREENNFNWYIHTSRNSTLRFVRNFELSVEFFTKRKNFKRVKAPRNVYKFSIFCVYFTDFKILEHNFFWNLKPLALVNFTLKNLFFAQIFFLKSSLFLKSIFFIFCQIPYLKLFFIRFLFVDFILHFIKLLINLCY